jgi:hypothetical protein
MNETTTSPHELLVDGLRLIQSRETELGVVTGDGPTSKQIASLLAALQPVLDGRDLCTPSELWTIFRSVTEIELAWLFPERDPLAQSVIPALQKIQTVSGDALCDAMPEQRNEVEKFANLAVAANLANRELAVNGNGPSWRMFLALCLSKIGLKRPAVAIANSEFERWRQNGK